MENPSNKLSWVWKRFSQVITEICYLDTDAPVVHAGCCGPIFKIYTKRTDGTNL